MDFTRLISRRLSSTRRDIKSTLTDGMPLGPPVFIQRLTNCEIIENSAARFECKVSGNPEPEVEWYKDGRLLKESKQLTFLYDDNDNCKLIITKGTAADAGEYTVVAENPHGKVSSTALLLIDTGSTDDESASDSELSEQSGSESEEKAVKAKDEKITKYYTVQDELGKGRFGVVCKCIDNKTGRAYAAKFIKCSTPKDRQDVIHEAEIMKTVRHKRLLRLQDFFQTPTEMILVMELVTGGELFEKVVEDEFISEIEVSNYMKQILEGIQHMHQREVLHLDLKPENIMLIRPDSEQIKLIDFGLARKYNPKENLKVMFGTPEFVAPEVIKYERITPATDMWSIGVIAYILMSGLSPFMGDTDAETLTNVQLADWDFDDPVFDEISDEAKEFISSLLVLAARKRGTVDQCLKHRWFTIKKDKGNKLIKTDRLKAFTARRKWKRAITAIRSTNFLSRILGSRGSDDKKGSGGGGGGLLARVKAMHAAGVQGPEGGAPPASSPFLSPASAAFSTSNSFTTVSVTERTRTQGEETVTKTGTVTETKGGKTTVETRKTTKTTTRSGDDVEQETSVTTEEDENGGSSLAGAANTPQAIAKRYSTGGLPLKLEGVDKYWGIKHELAKGRFSVIKRCLDAKTKKPFVAKIIKYEDDTDRDDTLQEFDIHRSIKGDKVVMLRDAFLMRRYLVLIMDLLEGQDILSFVASKPRPNEEDICFVTRPLIDVVNYLHGQKIVHLDIRPANIFIAKSNLGLKLIDYGSARRIKNWQDGDMLAIVSYNAFTAPELLDFRPVSGGADMWSIGVLVYALMSGDLPFAVQCGEDDDEDEKIAEAVKKGKWSLDSKAFSRCTSEVKDFITSLMSFDAKKRPSAEAAMKHPWLQGDNLQKRRSSDVNSGKLKDLSQQLMKKDKEDVVTASCVLRTFSEDPYDSPDSDEE